MHITGDVDTPWTLHTTPDEYASDTFTITALSGSSKWADGVLAPNGKIYGIPYNSTSVLIIDPVTGTSDITTIAGLSGSSKWSGGVLAPNGKIYGIPRDSTSVLIIDPVTNTADTTTIAGLSGETGKWEGGVLAPNGKIYAIPRNSTSVLIIDPVANTADTTTIDGLSGTEKWLGGVLSPNGNIYGIPINSTSVLVINPLANTADTTTITGLSGTYKWVGGVLAPDGKIYGIPHNSPSVLIIDPVTNTANTTTIAGLSGTAKWWGGVLAPDGKIYGIPLNSASVLIIDPVTNTADTTSITNLGVGGTKWAGGVLAPNGKMYGIPSNSQSALILTNDFEWESVAYGNNRFVAVATTGHVMTSFDGYAWTLGASNNLGRARNIAFGNGLFVVVRGDPVPPPNSTVQPGQITTIATSRDGITWTYIAYAGDRRPWEDIAYGNNIFVGMTRDRRVLVSFNGGLTWSTQLFPKFLEVLGVTYRIGVFVFVGSQGYLLRGDGIIWSGHNVNSNSWNSVAYGNGLFVAVASSGTGNRVMTSPDGITWTTRSTAGLDYAWSSVAFANNLFVAVAISGHSMISYDGITWTSRTTAANNSWRRVAYGNGLFVAVSDTGTGNRVMTANAGLPNLSLRASFSANLDMRNNEVVNVTSMTRDNVRIFMDSNTRSIQAQTWANNAWSTTTTTTQTAFVANKSLSVLDNSTLSGNLVVNKMMTVGSAINQRNLTVFGNLDIKGTTTTTRIESTTVQMQEMNLELGFLQVNTLASLNGGGLTVGGAGGLIGKRPTFAYNSALDAWAPNMH
jgi:hypothetical protein